VPSVESFSPRKSTNALSRCSDESGIG
jgi:hypothetical protein